MDHNGNAEGTTVFVQDVCESNDAVIDPGQQDVRYEDTIPDGRVRTPADQIFYNFSTDITKVQWPDSYQTCYRGCLCGYDLYRGYLKNFTNTERLLNPYAACRCGVPGVVVSIFFHLLNKDKIYGPKDLDEKTLNHNIPITPTNKSFLEYYGTNMSESTGSFYDPFFPVQNVAVTVNWVDIDEFDIRTIPQPFECFGDMATGSKTMVQYVNTSIFELHEDAEDADWGH